MKLLPSIIVSMFMLFGISFCGKNCDLDHIEGEVVFYLIENFEYDGSGCAIDEASVKLYETPYIRYDQILSYDKDEHSFYVDGSIIQLMDDNTIPVAGKAFAILANDELIYKGYFWPSYSSLSCDWYIIDPVMSRINEVLKVQMGYPGEKPGIIDPDMRNDERILCIFERDGKLK